MPTSLRPSGITVETRDGVTAQPRLRLRRSGVTQPGTPSGRGGRRRAPGASPAPIALNEEEAIVGALEAQQLDLVDAIPLAAAPTPAAGRRRRRGEPTAPAGGTTEVDLTVPLGPDEAAAVLVERDGVYEWHLMGAEGPAPAAPAPGKRRRRGATTEPVHAPTRTAQFRIAVSPAESVRAPGARRRRGSLLAAIGADRVVAFVFRFASRPILGGATRFLERNVREGLVHITGADPATWTTLADDAALPVPSGRAARVLLLVHGTFSSTVGSFGALAGQPDGRAFLEAALRAYDVVLGWDHRTLSVLPTDNAVDLAARVERIGFPQPPEVDAIAFSRGGLVLRSLVEYVLPSSPSTMTVRRAVFVACANGGTELARPENWHRFIDRYTNLAAAGARVAAFVPGFTSSAAILASSIRGVGVFVKAMATATMRDGAVPGIAAMDPGGAFVKEINEAQPGQPAPDQTFYCAITSNFDPDAAGRQNSPDVMPPALLVKLADKATDSLYGQPNDLVVHVSAMTQIDEALGAYVRERHDYGTNGLVHHCAYFSQPATARALANWLEVSVDSAPAAGRRRTTGAARGRPGAPALAAARTRAIAPAGEVVTLRSTMPVEDALAKVSSSTAPWIVVERAATEKGRPVTMHYAHPVALGRAWLHKARATAGATVHDAFELRETRRSEEAPLGAATAPIPLEPGQSPAILSYHHGSRYRTVLLKHGQPVGVVAAEAEDRAGLGTADGDGAADMTGTGGLTETGELEGLQWRDPRTGSLRTTGPGSTGPATGARRRRFRGGIRGTTPTTTSTPKSATRVEPTPATGTVACHFKAETDDEYVLEQDHTVVVTIAREALDVAAGRAGAKATARVKATKPLVVECLPMLRVALADPDYGRVQIPVPAAGAPAEIRFDLVGKEAGPGEIRVQVRQGPLPLVTLTLTVAVVAARSGTRRPVKAEADLQDFPATFPRATDELRIIQMRPTGSSTQYRYELRLPSKRIQREFESAVLDTDPGAYVAALHRRIEDRWAQYRSEKEAFARDLRAMGAGMFDELFPLELRQLLWQHRDAIGSVQVLSSEPFIPWELVHVRDPGTKKAGADAAFLGEIGVVRWLVSSYPPERLRIRPGKARYVVPDYPAPNELPAAAEEVALVTNLFGATAVDPEAEAVYRLIETPGQFDLLHIACHGVADPTDIDSARLDMPGKIRSDRSMSEEHVLATTVEREAQLADGEFQPIVVLNACQSARGGYSLKGMGGFAQAFVEGGAGVFVGSSWSVGDDPALAFIEEFYARFLHPTRPEPLARAAAAARRKAREDGDATWLAYVVYGHPRAVVRRT